MYAGYTGYIFNVYIRLTAVAGPGYALVQANGDKITVKRINEESLN
jgi:hypothetical protein